MTSLKDKSCAACEGHAEALSSKSAEKLLTKLNNWQISNQGKSLQKSFQFKGFYRTMAFVNAMAWIANQENHHPDFKVGYNYCDVTFTTHSLDGLSENDFICAAKVDALLP